MIQSVSVYRSPALTSLVAQPSNALADKAARMDRAAVNEHDQQHARTHECR
jgi:hypothetical protein